MRLLPALTLGLVLAAPLKADAQYNQSGPYDPFSWQVYNEGPGLKFGNDGMVFHPGVAAEVGYDSNVLLANQATGAPLLRLRLHLDLATLPPQRLDANSHPSVEFRIGGAFEYRQYLSNGTCGGQSCPSGTNGNIGFAHQLNGISDAFLKIGPYNPLSLILYNNFVFTNDALNLQVASQQTFEPRVYERFGALGTFKPGNGPLELGLGDSFALNYFFDLAEGDSVLNEAQIYAQLKVLPQTTLRLEYRADYVNYFSSGGIAGSASGIADSAPQKVMLIANTLLLPVLGASAYIGYGNSVHYGAEALCTTMSAGLCGGGAAADYSDTNYNNFLAGAELRLRMLARMRLALGWARDFNDSIFAAYESDDRFYLNYDHYIYRGLVARVNFAAYLRHYGDLVQASALGYTGYNLPIRNDVLVNLNADLGYRVLSWMELGVSYSYLDDMATGSDSAGDSAPFAYQSSTLGPIQASFMKHLVLARIDIAY